MILCPLTDDKAAFRQWDLKLVNALNYVKPGCGKALDRLKECTDRGEDPEDVRRGAASDWTAAHLGQCWSKASRGCRRMVPVQEMWSSWTRTWSSS